MVILFPNHTVPKISFLLTIITILEKPQRTISRPPQKE